MIEFKVRKPGASGFNTVDTRTIILLAAEQLRVEYNAKPTVPKGPTLGSPGDAKLLVRAALAQHDPHREHFLATWLDTQNRIICTDVLSSGTLNQTSVYPREVVRAALAANAASVIFAHNHPSGVAEPSRADEHLTNTLKEALAVVDVRVLDHIVVGDATCVSLAERGLV
jgi:DNA repair protein RadC